MELYSLNSNESYVEASVLVPTTGIINPSVSSTTISWSDFKSTAELQVLPTSLFGLKWIDPNPGFKYFDVSL